MTWTPSSGAADGGERGAAATNQGAAGDLLSMRLIALFSLLRRSGVLAQRRRFRLTEVEFRVMTQVGQCAPLSLNGRADLTLQDRGQLSRAVKAMTARGLLTRDRKPGGPEIEIGLTVPGRELYGQMVERVIERDRRLTDGLSHADLATLRRLTETMISRAEDMMAEQLSLGSEPYSQEA